MPACQVSDVLEAIRSVHRQLARRYQELNATVGDERIKLLLQDMQHREQQFDRCVQQFESRRKSSILQTWLQFVPQEATHIDRISERLAQPRTLSELVEETLVLNAGLCDAYLTMAAEAPIPDLQELFTNLAQLEECNDCHYATVLLDES
ncbi:MAG: hypothetical protein AB7U20_20515 [Planctomycetaceae bacterium]